MPARLPFPAGTGAETVCTSPSLHWTDGKWSSVTERLSIEAPLAIEIAYDRAGQSVRRTLAVTMRTPGADEELALGFLLAEGLIESAADIRGGAPFDENARGEKIRTWRVELARAPREDWQRVSRGLITSSACGLCGRGTLEGLPLGSPRKNSADLALSCELIAALPEHLRKQQTAFAETGGCHGAAIVDGQGSVLLTREDVGRHNAVDKLIGAAILKSIPLPGKILVLSGRASFELIQKAAVAGLAVVVAVGAPSSLAVDLAHGAGITLIGFARGSRFNVYTHADRVRPDERQPARASH